ncbi:hypothetical protein B484DRAFT_401925 [Ochromonadaceae sp. CCMP2298]|nr:hypothetical protein B484DRAFT_401925 [Ochromonadaceae sp. CCMP2298]
MALFSSDIFVTLRQMRAATPWGGFDFMPGQPAEYYLRRRQSVGDLLTEAQYVLAEEMGILIDQDENGGNFKDLFKKIEDYEDTLAGLRTPSPTPMTSSS